MKYPAQGGKEELPSGSPVMLIAGLIAQFKAMSIGGSDLLEADASVRIYPRGVGLSP
jgi:hypothetical protein